VPLLRPGPPTGFGADPAICQTCPHAPIWYYQSASSVKRFLGVAQTVFVHNFAQKTLQFHLLPRGAQKIVEDLGIAPHPQAWPSVGIWSNQLMS
jgi:hypothetical protein